MIVAFIGHRKIAFSQNLKDKLYQIIENLIVNENADIFLFGSKSEFDTLCYKVVSELKNVYPHISRTYVRAEYEYIDKSYMDYLLQSYEDTYFPQEVEGAGRLSYIKRNKIMIDKCSVLLVYFNETYQPKSKRGKTVSGTKTAVDYAKKKQKQIINLFDI
ncbi:MAG: hypothetical protein NC037_03060 [Bacteroides sp.]|nr:hypothetical protein [Bacillota bacterium]MCM1455493.1 hypothetical protein [Bacteroides sp.]